MKKLSLILTALFLFSAGNVFGQVQSDDIDVSAEILTAIQFANISNVNFGTINDNQNSILQPVGSETSPQNIGNDASLGSIEITGGGDALISWGNAILTESDDASKELTFVPEITDGADVLTSGSSNLTLSGTAVELSIGGELQGVATEGAGSYSTNNGGNAVPLIITMQYVSQ